MLIVQRRLTDYRVPLFEGLKRQLSGRGVALSLLYGEPSWEEAMRRDQGYLSWGTDVPSRKFSLGALSAVQHRVSARVLDRYDLIVLPHEAGILLNYRILWGPGRGRRKVAFWGHGRNYQKTNRVVIPRIKARLARQADWWFAYSTVTQDRLAGIGYPGHRVTVLNNSVDTRQLSEWRDSVPEGERAALIRSLQLDGQCVGLCLGGLIPQKRFDLLFSAADLIRKRLPKFELIIAGDGPLREVVRKWTAERAWARAVGSVRGRDKTVYASVARVMLNPGMVGLGILDAYACGVPFVTTDCGIHSPEIAYLVPGENGLMSDATPEAFAGAVVQLIGAQDLCEKLIERGRVTAREVTLENMIQSFTEGIIAALDAPRMASERGGIHA